MPAISDENRELIDTIWNILKHRPYDILNQVQKDTTAISCIFRIPHDNTYSFNSNTNRQIWLLLLTWNQNKSIKTEQLHSYRPYRTLLLKDAIEGIFYFVALDSTSIDFKFGKSINFSFCARKNILIAARVAPI